MIKIFNKLREKGREMKKILLAAVSLLMILACGNKESGTAGENKGSQPTENKQGYKIGVTQCMEDA